MQETLVMIKPDVSKDETTVQRIVEIYESYSLQVIESVVLGMSEAQASQFYEEHQGKEFFVDLVRFMASGRSIGLRLRGEDAVNRVRTINGATDPAKAEKGTIRRMFGAHSKLPQNVVHSSADLEAAQRELKFVFG